MPGEDFLIFGCVMIFFLRFNNGLTKGAGMFAIKGFQRALDEAIL